MAIINKGEIQGINNILSTKYEVAQSWLHTEYFRQQRRTIHTNYVLQKNKSYIIGHKDKLGSSNV